jgi:ribonuclease HI
MSFAYGWTDGSNGRSRGPAGAAAYVLADEASREVIEERCVLYPHTDDYRFTNNDMEMEAVHLLLQAAERTGVTDLKVHCDSEWVVKILREEYSLKMEKFRSLVKAIYTIADRFDSIEIVHIPREMNLRADWHCCVATEQRARKRPPQLIWDSLARR